ncbi:hypothetical protein CC86DRAFT_305427 [Ophiobolus disseminans]|uniref:Uncharacterized protein n=1 Tax=Ophiobolus disseminans TaxID=1469910 RepID=A0A6A6ZHH0_9PLEO|nr:hypothetical protein CC86DRAFT_305427 [Ophiobolus disseminans]
MPPKRVRAETRRYGVRNGFEEKEVRRIDSGNLGKDEDEQKDRTVGSDLYHNRATPHSLKRTPTTSTLPSNLSQTQVLKFLLSPAVQPFTLPINTPTPAATSRSYTDLLTPFEELLSAVILSRPIPHRLALRVVTTVLNAPYAFRNPVAIKTAGPRKIRQALHDAGMQHGDEEIDTLLAALCNNNWHNDLTRLRSHARNPIAAQREALRRSVAGLAAGGLDIFFRRVQWQWFEIFPFIDAGTQDALGNLGLPMRAEGLDRMIEVRWAEMGFAQGKAWSVEEGEKRRRAFVVCCERARDVDREGRVGDVIGEAQIMER